MREPKISFVSELKAQIINDLRRLRHYIMMPANNKSQLAYKPNGFIYGGAEVCKAWEFRNYSAIYRFIEKQLFTCKHDTFVF